MAAVTICFPDLMAKILLRILDLGDVERSVFTAAAPGGLMQTSQWKEASAGKPRVKPRLESHGSGVGDHFHLLRETPTPSPATTGPNGHSSGSVGQALVFRQLALLSNLSLALQH